jgi:hypothetical protein
MKFNGEAILEVLPEDGSCQEIEVDEELSFLDEYVEQARNMGLPDYNEERPMMEKSVIEQPRKKELKFKEYDKPQTTLPGVLNPYSTTQGSILTSVTPSSEGAQPVSLYPSNPENLGGLDSKLFQNKKKKWFEDDEDEAPVNNTPAPQTLFGAPVVPTDVSSNTSPAPASITPSVSAPVNSQPEPAFSLSKQDPPPKQVSKKTKKLMSGIFGGNQPASSTGAKVERKRRPSKKKDAAPQQAPEFSWEDRSTKSTPAPAPATQHNDLLSLDDDMFDMSASTDHHQHVESTPPKRLPTQQQKPHPQQTIDLLDDFLGPSPAVSNNTAAPSKNPIMNLMDDPFGSAPAMKPSTAPLQPSTLSMGQKQQMKAVEPTPTVTTSATKPGHLISKLMEQYPRANPNPVHVFKDTYISVTYNKFYKEDELILAFSLSTERGFVLTSINCQFQQPDKFTMTLESDVPSAVIRGGSNVTFSKLEPGNPITLVAKLKVAALGFGNTLMGTVGYADDQKRTRFNPVTIPIESADTFRPEPLNTTDYGNMWKTSHTVQKSVAIKSTASVEQMRDRLKEALRLHIVHTIKTEVIAAGRIMGLDAVFLTHINVGPQTVFTVRSKDAMLSDLVCRLASKALSQ